MLLGFISGQRPYSAGLSPTFGSPLSFTMADYNGANAASTSPSSALAVKAEQQRHDATSPYQYHPTSSYAHDALPDGLPSSSHYGHGPTPRHDQAYLDAASAHALTATSQPGQQPGSHHQQRPNAGSQHHGNVSPALPYPSAAPINQGSGSPSCSGHQPPTPTDSASPPATSRAPPAGNNVKKNTRIPRACDLCSQRKVKVLTFVSQLYFLLPRGPATALVLIYKAYSVRRRRPTMSTMPRTQRALHLRPPKEASRTSQPSRRGSATSRADEETEAGGSVARTRSYPVRRDSPRSERSSGACFVECTT